MKKNSKNNMMSFVERMFSKHNTSTGKKWLILFSVIGLISSLVLSITLPIVLKQSPDNPIYYKFDNKYFTSKKEIYDYSYKRSIDNDYSFESNKYLFDDKVFNSKEELNTYMEEKFKISSIETKRNPNDYLINTSGELSALVKTSNYEQVKRVYKGLGGSAYFSEEDAKKTYLNNYSLNYTVDGQIFENMYSAQKYYLDIKLKELEENGKKVMCYEQGAMCQSKEHITSWIRNNVVKGFEYQGQQFSDLNYVEFLEAMKELDTETIDKYVKPVLNGDKSSYWVTQNSNRASSYFVGPKYFESNEKVSSIAHFEPIKTYDVNALLMLNSIGAAFTILNIVLDSTIKHNNTSDYEMMDYLENTFNQLELDMNLLEKFERKYNILSPNLRSDLSVGLDDINDKELTDFYRLLISFKRFLDLARVYNLRGINPNDLEQLLKEIIVEILNSQKELANNIFDIENNNSGADILLDKSISFDDIYNLFLNTDAFFNDGGIKGTLWQITEKALGLFDSIMDTIGTVTDNVDKINENINKTQKSNDKSDKNYQRMTEQNTKLAEEAIYANQDIFFEELGIDSNQFTTRNPLLIVGIVVAAWNLGKVASFTTLKTYEAKLDSYQSLYYFEPTFKIPFTNITFGNKVKDQTIHTLTDAPLNYFSPNVNGKPAQEIYEFNGRYYKEKDKAIKDLEYEIYKNPEEYLVTKQIFSSVLENDNGYVLNLDPICSSNNEENKESNCISRYEYEKQYSEQKEKYVQQLFNTHYEKTGKQYYVDGFGGAWNSLEEAKKSLEQKADSSENYNQVYSYSINNKKVVKDSKEEIQEFILQNQVVESKTVINTDLIQTSYYDNLKENNGYDFQIYTMNYYGQEKYFRTYLEALNYLDKKVNYEVFSYNRDEKTYTYNGVEFVSQNQFDYWIDSQIQIVSEKEYLEKGGRIYNDKTSFNSTFYY